MIEQTKQDSWYQSSFDRLEKGLNGSSASAVHKLRQSAIARFRELGFPTTRHEEWRFTNVAPIAKTTFQPVLRYSRNGITKADIARLTLSDKHVAVFINGHFSPELSSIGPLPDGAVVGSLASALESHPDLVERHLTKYAKFDESAFVALNTAFLQDGAYVQVPEGTSIDHAIHLLFIGSASDESFVSHPRNLILVGNGSRVRIVESYVSMDSASSLTNVVTEAVVGKNSLVEHDKLQNEVLNAYHVAGLYVYQLGGSNFTSNSVALGGSIVRNNVIVVLDEEGSECTLNGLSLATGSQLIDNHTVIDHAKPHCNSHELYKSILDGASKGVFNGKIFVRKDAQKTDAKQTNKTLLLSDGATVDTKPQLEIFADDVKCTHGAAVGQLDPDQIFYLRTRGLSATEANDMLTFAFASEVVSRIHVDTLRNQLEQLIHERLSQGRKIGIES